MEKIPSLDDTSLKNLLENARRLAVSGGERQKADAAELLPALEAAFAQRRAVKLEAAAEKRAAARKTPAVKKVAVKAN